MDSNEDWKNQLAVIEAQVGDYAKAVQWARVYPENENLYRAEAINAIGHIVVQCQLTCSLLGVNYNKVVDDAVAEFAVRMNEVAKERLRKMKEQ